MKKLLKIQSWKSLIKNLSIHQKMITALVVCIIIPIILLGVFTTTRVLRLSEQNQYEMQMNQLTKAGKDIDSLYNTIIREGAALAGEQSIKAVASRRASVMDYKNAAKRMAEASEKIPHCSSIALSKNGEVLFQRGEQYMDEKENVSYTDQIELEKRPYLWVESHPVKFKRGLNATTLNQISYYTTVLKELTLENEGILSIHINAAKFIGQFISEKGEEIISNIIIFDGQGNALVEHKNIAGLQELSQSGFQKVDKTDDAGYFQIKTDVGTQIVLYTKCEDSGWYLFQIEKKISLYSTQIVFMAGVVLLCVIFGMVYGMIQNKTIIIPLQRLSNRMNVVKSGVLEKEYPEVAHDEIGNVEKGFEDMVAHINKLINQVYMQTIKTQDAEREMLLTQMNPHFLYNSLDAIHWQAIRNKDYEVSEQLEALADVYRHILKFGEGMISLERDMEFIDNYLFLLESQMGDRIEFIRDIPEQVYGCLIPKLMIQPLIENSVQHGLRDTEKKGFVKIRMRIRGTELILTVLDNGSGCDTKRIMGLLERKREREAFALRNIHERVKLRWGEGYGLRIYSKSGRGTIVQIKMKLEREKHETDDCG